MLMMPPIPHISRASASLCVASTTPLGEMNIPVPRSQIHSKYTLWLYIYHMARYLLDNNKSCINENEMTKAFEFQSISTLKRKNYLYANQSHMVKFGSKSYFVIPYFSYSVPFHI